MCTGIVKSVSVNFTNCMCDIDVWRCLYIQQSTKNYYSAFIVLKWVWEIWELHPKTQHPIVNPLWLSRSLCVFSAGEWRYSTVFIAVSVTIWIARYVLQWVTLLLHQETKKMCWLISIFNCFEGSAADAVTKCLRRQISFLWQSSVDQVWTNKRQGDLMDSLIRSSGVACKCFIMATCAV